MAQLFGVGVPAISKHLKNIFEENELDPKVVVSNGNNHSTWCNRRKNSKEWDIFLFNLKALGHSWKIMFPQSSKFCYQFWDTARKRHFLTLVTKKLANLVTKSVTKLSNHVHFRIYAFRLRTRRLNIYLPAWCQMKQVERSWISMSYG